MSPPWPTVLPVRFFMQGFGWNKINFGSYKMIRISPTIITTSSSSNHHNHAVQPSLTTSSTTNLPTAHRTLPKHNDCHMFFYITCFFCQMFFFCHMFFSITCFFLSDVFFSITCFFLSDVFFCQMFFFYHMFFS